MQYKGFKHKFIDRKCILKRVQEYSSNNNPNSFDIYFSHVVIAGRLSNCVVENARMNEIKKTSCDRRNASKNFDFRAKIKIAYLFMQAFKGLL